MNMKVMNTSPLEIMKKLNILNPSKDEKTVQAKNSSARIISNSLEENESKIFIKLDIGANQFSENISEPLKVLKTLQVGTASIEIKVDHDADKVDQQNSETIHQTPDQEGDGKNAEDEDEESETQIRMRMLGFPSKFISRRDTHKRVKHT